jgi:hypothetical protein
MIRRLADERGMALVIALVVLLLMLLLTTAVVAATTDESSLSNRDTAEKRSFEAAQAGLQETQYRLNMVINSNTQYSASTLLDMCLGGQIDASGNVTLNSDSLQFPAAFYAYLDCGPYTESLGNGAFYKSWTSVAYISNTGTCAGASIGQNALVMERCITAEGIVCPPSYTSPSQLPCPGEVVHRVEERAAAYAGRPLFPLSGVFGLNGILIQNSARILSFGGQPVLETNKQLAMRNTAQATGPVVLPPAAPNPILQNQATLGSPPACNSTTVIFPTNCVQRSSGPYVPTPVVPPPTNYDPSSQTFSWPDGDRLIANAFQACGQQNTCAHDSFSGCNSASSCGWNPTTRTLNIPNGVTWTMSGGTYNFCTLTLSGQSVAVLPPGVRSAIYIDSPADNSASGNQPPCTASSGYISFGNQSQFINESPPQPGSPLVHDSTALQIYVFGPSDVPNPSYNNNACVNNSSDLTCVLLGNRGDFYGTVYAPNSDVAVSNQGNDYGAVLGSTVMYNNPGFFEQDVNVTSLITTGALGIYFRTAWSDCQIKPTVASNPMSGC